MTDINLEKFAEKLGNNLFNDLKRDLRVIIPRWLETMLKQRLKGIQEIEERVDRMEQDNRQRNKDIEHIALSIEKLQEDFAKLTISTQELPKEVKKIVKKDNEELAKATAESFETISERRPSSLWKFWKRGNRK